MSAAINDLRECLENRDLAGFLSLYETQAASFLNHPELGQITQRILPTVLRELLTANRVQSGVLVCLWRMVRSGQLLVVDTDILESINELLEPALAEMPEVARVPAQKLRTYAGELAEPPPRATAPVWSAQQTAPLAMRRIVISSSFSMGFMNVCDAFNFKRNLCASSQELEFLRAVRQFFPGLRAYPNLPLRNFIDPEALGAIADDSMRRYCWSSQVDVLLCTEDEDPVAGIELDSVHHDSSEAQERDALKNRLFRLAGLPLVRIRPSDTVNVRAEDFYDLMMAEAESLDALRPRRLRPRRNHDVMVPADIDIRQLRARAA